MNKHVVCVWEMGGNFGPIGCLASLTQEFLHRGYRVTVVVRDLKDYYQFFSEVSVGLFQSPAWGPPLDSKITINCFSDILLWRGYNNTAALKMMLTAWRHFFQLLKPDLVIFNGAPTALLSAHYFDFFKIVVGTGFDILVPGLTDRPFVTTEDENFDGGCGDKLLNNINAALSELKLAKLDHLSDIYAVSRTFITNIPELDLFAGSRIDSVYCPPVAINKSLPPLKWPEGRRIRGLAYLHHNIKGLNALFQIALEANISLAAVVNGGSDQKVAELQELSMLVSNKLHDIESSIDECGFSIVNGGLTLVQSLLHGKPVLIVPMQKDHLMVARLLEKKRLGICVGLRDSKADLLKKITEIANNEFFTLSAREIRDRYSDQFSTPTHILIGNECDRLLGVG